MNAFGIWKEYLYRPSYDPDASVSAKDLRRPHPSTISTDKDREEESSGYTNKSIQLLLDWQNTGSSTKSNDEINRLVHDVLFHPDFQLGELQRFNARRENHKANVHAEESTFLLSFQHATVNIEVPSGSRDTPSQRFPIPGLYYRKLIDLIKETFKDPISLWFHLSPFKLFRKNPDGNENERVYSELYDSDMFIEEHDKVQHAPTGDPYCRREKVVVALMFWSDVTHLASFGTAKLWPVYMLFGNLSKYIRCQPNSGAIKHLAYIPPFPDSLQDQLRDFHQKWDSQQKDILTFCRRELMHEVWKFLLDDDFLQAYHYGTVVRCYDGVERRIYPRIFTYSADYPEKYVF
jgi:hypothetical protein